MDDKKWRELEQACESCKKCGLHKSRNKLVFGKGSRDARILFVGEAPGEAEDAQGVPFVGRAGQLLDKYLLVYGFTLEHIYVANILKCRPPGNRDPHPDEVAACIGYLREQTRIINPQYIVCLGRVAAQSIIDPSFKVTKQHGEFIQKGGIWMMGTYHPAALLRNPHAKPDAFDDLCKLRDRLLGAGE